MAVTSASDRLSVATFLKFSAPSAMEEERDKKEISNEITIKCKHNEMEVGGDNNRELMANKWALY